MTPQYVIRLVERMATTDETKLRLQDIRDNVYPSGFCEPGYTKGTVVILGNWNAPDRYDAVTHSRIDLPDGHLVPRLKSVLEKMGCETDWDDENIACEDCARVFRSEPDSYWWQPFGYSDLKTAQTLCNDCWAKKV